MSEDEEDLFDDVSDVSGTDVRELENFNIQYDKNKFDMHIQNKIEKLDERMRYVNYKFEDVRQSFKRYSISIIYLATILTLTEAFTNALNLESINNPLLINFIKFIPLILSSLISLLAALIKFNKYEEKIEEITRSTEKCIVTLAKLKEVKEELYFCRVNEKIKKVTDHYRKTVYKEYLDSNTSIERQLVDTDYAKYMKKVATNDIKRNEIQIQKKKKLDLMKKKPNKPTTVSNTNQIELNISELEDGSCMKKYRGCLIGCKR